MREKTFSQRKEDVQQSWRLFDASGCVLGRLASQIAGILRGKDKATYTPHIDGGDFVVVINAAKIKLTGNKLSDKPYYRHSGYMGGLKTEYASSLLEREPEQLIKKAVWGMLPKGPLGRQMLSKLKVYADASHPHEAQQPVTQTLTYRAVVS